MRARMIVTALTVGACAMVLHLGHAHFGDQAPRVRVVHTVVVVHAQPPAASGHKHKAAKASPKAAKAKVRLRMRVPGRFLARRVFWHRRFFGRRRWRRRWHPLWWLGF